MGCIKNVAANALPALPNSKRAHNTRWENWKANNLWLTRAWSGNYRRRINKLSVKLKRRVKLLVGKPGLDGHSSGAEQISVAARDAGIEVVYQGIRLTPEQIVNTAIEESVHMIALSILSGSHLSLTKETIRLLKKNKISKIPIVVGGIIPTEDEKKMLNLGVSRIYTPKNYDINLIMSDFVNILEKQYL